MKFIFIAIVALTFSISAFAKYQISLTTSHITRNANYEIGSEVVYEETRSPLEIKFGNVLSNNIYIGGIYNMGTRSVKTSSGSRKEQLTAYGATIGYDPGKWYLHLSYYLSAELDLDNNQVFKEGSGFQIDIGNKIRWGAIYIVPQISYSDLSFKKRENGSSEADVNSSSFGGIIPQIAFMYEF